MSERLELAIEAYHDGSLDAEGAQVLAAALRGTEALAVRERLSLAGLLAQAFTSDDAVARSIGERIEGERSPSTVVRAVQRSIAGSRQWRNTRSTLWSWLPVAALVCVIVTVGWWINADQQPQAVECHLLVPGPTLVERGGRAVAVRAGMALVAGDRVLVGVSAGASSTTTATAEWADGSRLVFAAGSVVVMRRPALGAGVHLEHGELDADITKQPYGSPFTISTPEALVEVLGTRFHLRASTQRTICKLHEGAVTCIRRLDQQRLTMQPGQTVTVAHEVPFQVRDARETTVAASLPQPAAWSALFPAGGLAGWQQPHGTWRHQDGVVHGSDVLRHGKARILSPRSFTDLELTCRLRISGVEFAEVQVGDYNWFVEIPGKGATWVEVHLLQVGNDLRVTADGVALKLQPGAGAAMRPGPLSFFVMAGGALDISDARFRIPAVLTLTP